MPDFGFVGASYEAPSIYQDAQECINYYPEIDPTKQPGSRGVVALYPTPGLVQEYQLNPAEVRGMRGLSGGQYLLIVCGNAVYQIGTNNVVLQVGNLQTNSGPVDITDTVTTNAGLVVYIVDGVSRYTYQVSSNGSTNVVELPPTDGLWQGATSCDTVDSYVIYNEPNTQNWAVTDLGLVVTTTGNYGSKDGAPDNLVTLIVDHRQVYLLGEVTTEVWVDVGNVIPGLTTFPFQRISGTTMQHGCAAAYSVSRFAESFMFVSKDTRGQAIIGAVNGYQFVRTSTHAVEQSLVNVDVSDARAYTYQIQGHEMYVVTFPQIDLTWVYDNATQQWHKWLSWDSLTGYHRHRSNCGALFNNKYWVGDYENGKIYTLDNAVYTENGLPIRRVRRAIHLTTDLQRQYFEEFQIQFQPGVGLISGQGQDPQVMLRWSNDGGSTWSNEHWVGIGRQGQYQNRAIWRRLGWARDRIFEVAITDPVNPTIISANLKASVGDN
jgi:hypothetical protein